LFPPFVALPERVYACPLMTTKPIVIPEKQMRELMGKKDIRDYAIIIKKMSLARRNITLHPLSTKAN